MSSSAIRAAEAAALAAATDPSPTIYPQDARVDNGHLVPLSNIYPNAPQDWMHDAVQRLIVERKLAPFYRGLDDWEPPDDDDDFDRDALDLELDKVGDEQSRNWRTSTYSKQDRLDEAMMYKKASECPICFLWVFASTHLLGSQLTGDCRESDTTPHSSTLPAAATSPSAQSALSRSSEQTLPRLT